MKILAPLFILLSFLAACEQPMSAGYPMGMEGNEMNEMNEGNEAGERH